MLKVFSYLKSYKLSIVIALSLMLTELVVELWHPLLMAHIIDDGIIGEDLSAVLRWGGIMVVLALIGFAAGIVNSFFAAHVSQSFGFDLRKHVFGKIQTFSFANFNKFPASTLITRLTSDVNQLQNIIFMGLRILMRAPLLMLGGLVMALIVNAKLALVLVLVTPVLLVFLLWIMNKGFTLFRLVQERLDTTNGVLRESLIGMRLIKAFVRFGHEVRRFTKANDDLMDRMIAALRLVELTLPLLLLVMNLSILYILWSGNRAIGSDSAEVGEIVAIVNYTLRITGAFSVVSLILTSVSRAKASGQRLAAVLDTKVDIVDSDEVNGDLCVKTGKLSFENVSFCYPDTDTPVLGSVSFTVQPGETLAIMGATGAGKSTLFQLIPRLYDVNGGTIKLDDADIRYFPLESLRMGIGFVPQEALLFTGTVRENIRWGNERASEDEMIEAARRAQIHETIMKLPKQYDTVIGQKGVNLSGGQKQRLSVARALIRKPNLLLLDDSTSALDAKTEANLLAALKEHQCTTLIITQKISTAMEADKIILLEEGRVLAEGGHEQLLHSSPLYRQIVQSQLGEGVAI
ncbi:ABC transporter ATP-binding protein [Paenibacillus abyssi]|uniref:ABC transporter ATP-binding protein YfiB n=1 Tax=Paenibacillus abyssi TaxID=1340531 RepID=A0A917CMT4_9BACL|nr:ABC transporter ATP-binding protein [Paenibacillus abyssi]GGF92825.1 putative ABC transporter ATP-binding protein YfiB [Paenibacillus abyssi]